MNFPMVAPAGARGDLPYPRTGFLIVIASNGVLEKDRHMPTTVEHYQIVPMTLPSQVYYRHVRLQLNQYLIPDSLNGCCFNSGHFSSLKGCCIVLFFLICMHQCVIEMDTHVFRGYLKCLNSGQLHNGINPSAVY